ncbi:MAG: S1C family serine protease [Bilifractor sp.]
MDDERFNTHTEDRVGGEKEDKVSSGPYGSGGGTEGQSGEEPEKSYQFMHQVIRKKPRNRKAEVVRVLSVLGIGIIIGVVSAFVHAGLYPVAKQILGRDDEKVTIPSDNNNTDAEASLSASSSSSRSSESVSSEAVSSSVSDTVSASMEAGIQNASSGTNTTGMSGQEDAEGTAAQETSESGEQSAGAAENGGSTQEENPNGKITLEQYQQLYQEMIRNADNAKKSLVEVISITSQLDYFNEDYQTQKQVAGILVAQTDDSYYILTENSILDGAENIMVKFSDDTLAQATLRKADTDTGLAVLSVNASDVGEATKNAVSTAPLGNSNTVKQGDPVLALGNLMGYSDIVANGNITSISNKTSVFDAEYSILTTDIEGSTSTSGILVNMQGEIVGLIPQNMAENGNTLTAYAISDIKPLIERLSNNESVAFLGIKGREVTESLSKTTGIPVGLLVTEVEQDSPAMLAGCKEFDVIENISGTEIRTVTDLENLLGKLKANNVITVTAMRQGADGYAEVTFSVSLGER